jgi:hypothetical protein
MCTPDTGINVWGASPLWKRHPMLLNGVKNRIKGLSFGETSEHKIAKSRGRTEGGKCCDCAGNVYVRGWMNYFGISEYYRPIPEIDSRIRRRVRMCCIKPLRRGRTRIRKLMSMGVLPDTAIRTGLIERESWYLSGVLGVQNAFPTKWACNRDLYQ